MRRSLLLLVALATMILLGSCSVMRDVPRSDLVAVAPESAGKFARFSAARGQRVYGYTTTDGRFHSLPGWARVEGDSVAFHRPEGSAGWPPQRQPALTERVAVADLTSVRSEAVGTLPTVLLVVVGVGLLGLFVLGKVMSGLG
jgi:hypothetical protein